MQTQKIKVSKLHPDAIIPTRNNPADAGLDLHILEGGLLPPGHRVQFKTGIAIDIPEGYVGLIWSRSKLSTQKGIQVLAGVVDAGYRGDISVVLYNSGYEPVVFNAGDKLAQLLIQEVSLTELELVDELPESVRGTKGINCEDLRL